MAYKRPVDRKTINETPVRSVSDHKATLMTWAENGESSHTPEQMSLLIEWRLSAQALRPEEERIVHDINPFQATISRVQSSCWMLLPAWRV